MNRLGAVAVALSAAAVLTSAADADAGRNFNHHSSPSGSGDAIDLAGARAAAAAARASAFAASQPGRHPEYERAAACREAAGRWVKGGADGSCPAGIDEAFALDCDDEVFQLPLWRRIPIGPAGWSAWDQIDAGGCGEMRPVFTLEDFRRLPLAAPVLILQPDRGWVLVNIETIVRTERVEQTFQTNLAGYDVEVIATPERFHYDFGDGTDLWTRSAGHPYPDHDTFRVYETLGTYQVTLTTEWSGRYRIAGDDTWYPVTGTAQTSTTSAPFEVVERRSRLVDDLCTDIPKPADC